MKTASQLKYFWVYPAYSQNRIDEENRVIERLRGLDIDVTPVPIPVSGWWTYQTLDTQVKNGSYILSFYDVLQKMADSKDCVVFVAGGSMMHPDYLKNAKALTFAHFGDDPESSEILSKPVAQYFDIACTSNIAEVDAYRSWGVKDPKWLFIPFDNKLSISRASDLNLGERPQDISFFGERIYAVSDRASRIDTLVTTFQNRVYVAGKGWANGFVPFQDMKAKYAKTKIGWNLHNSTGPCNSRLMALPAMGVMQICDNKSNLAKIFYTEGKKEAVGFDTIEECVDLTKYYLAHDKERQNIAFWGWRAVITKYSVVQWWRKIEHYINEWRMRA